METRTIMELPAITLISGDWENTWERPISWSQLKKAKVGDKFEQLNQGCGRNELNIEMTIIYKDDTGCACVMHEWGTTDSPNPEDWEKTWLNWFGWRD